MTRLVLWVVVWMLIAFYMLFAAKVASQWEKVIVLRLGKFQGLKGPGLFWIIPIIDIGHCLDRPSRECNAVLRRKNADKRYRSGRCGCRALLGGLGCRKGRAGSRRLQFRHCLGRADRPARYHRAHDAGRHPHRAQRHRRRAAAHHRRAHHALGCDRQFGRDPRHRHPAGPGRCHVPPGAGRARTPGARHPGRIGETDRRIRSPRPPNRMSTTPPPCTCAP